jgi:acyl carrier protein
MDREQIIATLGRYVADEILRQPTRTLKADQSLVRSGLIDSFSLVDVQAFIERAFGVWIEDPDFTVATGDTLNQIAGMVIDRLKR